MSKHVFACVLTHYGVAANNRGENQGNTTTLRKIMWKGRPHSSLSSESIRYAGRMGLQELDPTSVNRSSKNETGFVESLLFEDPDFNKFASGNVYSDDDLYGFMNARSQATEDGKKTKNMTRARRGAVDVSPGISLTEYTGEITFNAARPGASPAAQRGQAGERSSNPVPYSTEVHATRYQYNFAMSLDGVKVPKHALMAIKCLCGLGQVAGNHARYLFDCSPQSVVFRLTDDMAPRICYVFEDCKNDKIDFPSLLFKVKAGDIDPKELYIGGPITETETGKALSKMGTQCFDGIKKVESSVLEKITEWTTPKNVTRKGAK